MASVGGIDIGDNLHWRDEYQWAPVAAATERTLSGALVVEEAALTKGRPITLAGAWLPRTTVDALRALEAQVATPLSLVLPDARTFSVLWRRDDGPAVEAQPLFAEAAPGAGALYEVTLRLMEA